QRAIAREALGVDAEIIAQASAPTAVDRQAGTPAALVAARLLSFYDRALGALHFAVAVIIVPDDAVVGVEAGQFAGRLLRHEAARVLHLAGDVTGQADRRHRLPASVALHEEHVAGAPLDIGVVGEEI